MGRIYAAGTVGSIAGTFATGGRPGLVPAGPAAAQRKESERLIGRRTYSVLTDRYAPVDQMLAPVFREEVPR